MRQAIIYLLLFVTFPSFAQDVEKLKIQDTVYIVLNSEYRPKNFSLSVNRNEIHHKYVLTEISNYKKIISIISYTNKDHVDNIKIRRKLFFKNHGDEIINTEFIQDHGLEKVFLEYLKDKVIYIIDEKCFNKRKFVLRKASVVPIGYAKM